MTGGTNSDGSNLVDGCPPTNSACIQAAKQRIADGDNTSGSSTGSTGG